MSGVPSMVSASEQLLELLRTLEATVTEQWPRRELDGPTIVVQEISNTATDVNVVDSLSYQVDVWAEEADTVRSLFQRVDDVISGMGWKRSFCPSLTRDGFGRRQTARYSRKVDKRTLRLID